MEIPSNDENECLAGTFLEQGYAILRSEFRDADIELLLRAFREWQCQSSEHTSDFGDAPQQKRRFVLGATHDRSAPCLRRVNNPCDISTLYFEFVLTSQLLKLAQRFLGSVVRFHHCKINCKSGPEDGSIDLHQDFGFDPHTNGSLITLVVPFVKLTPENGCLEIVPGSHLTQVSHFIGTRFTGAIPGGWDRYESKLTKLDLKVGDCLLMDGSLIHGSRPNRTRIPRPVLFAEFSAADALPLAPYHVPSQHSGRLFPPTENYFPIRLETRILEVPLQYTESSIFELQQVERTPQ